MAPTSSAPSLRSLTFPPEVLLHIISFASESLSGEHYMDLNERNADLASLALVNRAFQEATYSVLYGDLRLSWVADKVKMLFRSFEENHHLLPLVRRLEATALHRTAWINDQVKIARDNADHLKQASFDTYCEQEGIEEDSQEWLQVVEDTFGSKNSALEEAWAVEFRKDAEDAWKRNGHGAWRSQGNREGAHEFLDIITSAPALRSLLVCGFKHTLSATDIDIASRGPYPLIEYLEVPHLHTSSPFFVNHTLPSLLASSTPNLRSLRGHVRFGCWSERPITLPPSLTQLEIIRYDQEEPRINFLLLQVQPTLRSLTLVPARPGWASSPTLAALLSTVESFYFRNSLCYNHDEDNNPLARAIAPSSSLRHLALVPATTTLIASLPPSLQSIIFSPPQGEYEIGIKRTLELMKAAGTHPLRVEFFTRAQSEGRMAWEECRDAYAAAGHTLSVRFFYEQL